MTESSFNVVSWNVNSIKARLPHLIELLNVKKPDLLCLQELKCVEETFPLKEIESIGYHSLIYGQKTYNGVALLSKKKLQNPHFDFDNTKKPNSARLISAQLGNTTFYSVYAPNGQEVGSEKYQEKLKFYKSLKELIENRHTEKESIILGGDFNVAPEEIDVHDPDLWRGSILFSDRERKALTQLQGSILIDSFRYKNPKSRSFSWWDYRSGAFQKNEGLRIDLILASKKLQELIVDAGIYAEYRKLERPSDHAPVFTKFSFHNELFAH